MHQIDLDSVHFITDNTGKKQAAVLPISLYHELLSLKSALPEHSSQKAARFHFDVKGVVAYGYPKGSQAKPNFIIIKDSWAFGGKTTSLRPGIQKLRDNMLNEGILRKIGDNYQFQQNYTFNSPSMAACLVAGNARSGMDAWINEKGFSLKACGYGKE